MRFLATAALLTAMATPAAAVDLNALSPAERDAFRAEVRAFLIENPEVLLEAMEVLRGREAEAEAAKDRHLLSVYAEEIFNDGISWVGGNPDGDITIVEFLDYRCGYCRRAHDDVAKLLDSDGQIRWVVKELPILGPDSDTSSKLAVATLRQLGNEAYGRLHDVLMTFEGPVNEKTLPIVAKRAGIDLADVQDEMESDGVADHIARVRQLAGALEISGTPSFVIGNTFVRGYVPLQNMQAIIADLREKG